MSYTVIIANGEQVEKLYEKHLKPWFGIISKVGTLSYWYDQEDDIGNVTIGTLTGKTVEFQLREDEPCFVHFTGFADIRYDIHYPKETHLPMYELLKSYGIRAKKDFWKGGDI